MCLKFLESGVIFLFVFFDGQVFTKNDCKKREDQAYLFVFLVVAVKDFEAAAFCIDGSVATHFLFLINKWLM